MMWGTHIGIPAIAAAATDLVRHKSGRPRLFSNWQIRLIGLSGILPDLASPHFSLHSRHESWSHTLWFLLGVIVVTLILARMFSKRNWGWLTMFVAFGVFMHLVMDALSGGIPFTLPYGDIWGGQVILWSTWLYWDIAFITCTIGTFQYMRLSTKPMN